MIFQIKSTKESISSEIKGSEAEIIYAIVKIMKADGSVKKLLEKALRAYDFVENAKEEAKSESTSECDCHHDEDTAAEEKSDDDIKEVHISEEDKKMLSEAIKSMLSKIFPKCPDCGEHHPQ